MQNLEILNDIIHDKPNQNVYVTSGDVILKHKILKTAKFNNSNKQNQKYLLREEMCTDMDIRALL